MRDFNTPRVFILSAHKRNATPEANQLADAELACDLALEGFPFTPCQGFFEGQCERGFIVKGAGAQDAVIQLALAYGQDSILLVAEHDRAAYLVDLDSGYHKHLGKLVCVGDQCPDADAWTRVDDSYFVTQPTGRLVDLPEGL